jgi:hypothetical protein
MRRFTKRIAFAVIVTNALLEGAPGTSAQNSAPTITQSEASCNDDAVRKLLLLFARDRGMTLNPVLGRPHTRGGYCEILLSNEDGEDLGNLHYVAVGYKWAPVVRLYDWPNK